MPNRNSKARGFTLLELLVVVAVLAIIGGALLVAYDDVDDMASEGVAAHTLASLDSSVRSFDAVTGSAPNRLDALIAADYDGTTPPATALANPEHVLIMHSNFNQPGNKGVITTLNQAQLDALNAAGITHLRYVDAEGNDDVAGPINAPDADGNAITNINSVFETDIPHRVHEAARPGNARRGRGFERELIVGDPVIVWNANRSGGTGGYDNTKIGAGPNDVVIVFGLGNDATCVGSTNGRVQLASAPVYGKRQNPWEYGRYLLCYNVGPVGSEFSKARLQVVMNPHGDFVDEMIAEHGLQKP